MEAHSKIEETVDNIKDYINTRYELVGLQAAEKVSGVASNIISGVLILVLMVLSVVLLSISAAWAISAAIGYKYSGFLIVGGVYLLAGVLLAVFKDKMLSRPFRNIIIKQLFKEEDEQEKK
jgi:hypothetical protein